MKTAATTADAVVVVVVFRLSVTFSSKSYFLFKKASKWERKWGDKHTHTHSAMKVQTDIIHERSL